MMKNIFIVLLFLSCFMAKAQIGIGTPMPDPSAVLELKSSTKGFLPPGLTTLQRNAIASPIAGLVIYNTTKNCMEWFDGTTWYNGCGVQESSGGIAVVTAYSCSTNSVGALSVGTPVSGVTQTITATVDRVGTYSISASANGVTFTGSGSFAGTGSQDIVLTATGTPLVVANSNFVLDRSVSCNFSRNTL